MYNLLRRRLSYQLFSSKEGRVINVLMRIVKCVLLHKRGRSISIVVHMRPQKYCMMRRCVVVAVMGYKMPVRSTAALFRNVAGNTVRNILKLHAILIHRAVFVRMFNSDCFAVGINVSSCVQSCMENSHGRMLHSQTVYDCYQPKTTAIDNYNETEITSIAHFL